MISRTRLLEAAAQVFSEAGFRGATTRRIAEVAGVNEVTLFRLFGSKAQLLTEALACVHPARQCGLPEDPGHVERELTAWATEHLALMRGMRTVLRRTLAELDDHPDMREVISATRKPHLDKLLEYCARVRKPRTAAERDQLRTACTMLASSLFADALGRDVVPAAYPDPEDEAARKYVRVFLTLLGVQPARLARQRVGRSGVV